ncbi:type II toxin-antitoxin system HipA family toxin [Arthrobacter sp. 7Tela_A1]|uniref:type II toxin-antitoxin system HipA family toxin n=1 Tax=Arthrobacter sp. 7Tela_A1 TaxID=3093745 RepID=UPI003BB6AD2A
MKTLLVLLHKQIVGLLEQNDHGRRTFRYVENTNPYPDISSALPYRLSPYPQRQTDAFINGLLPEGVGVRESLGKEFRISSDNPFALLEHIGMDCAGAIQFVSPNEFEAAISDEGKLVPFTDEQIGSRLRSLISEPKGSWIVNRERWSLAGAQSKFALRWNDGWFEAEGAEATTHIIKPGIHDFSDQALNEHLSLRALGKAGLAVANTEFRDFDGSTAIVIERYDRLVRDGRVIRIHQEDFCQATSTPPNKKYESDGGPNAIRIIRTLRHVGADEEQVQRFVEGLIGNYLLGAPDAHAKNYSIILDSGTAFLAPLYDIASGLPYSYTDDDGVARKREGLRTAAMAIGGERRFGMVARRHWVRFASDADLNEEWLIATVRALAVLLPDMMNEVFQEEAEAIGDSELPHRLQGPLRDLCDSTLTLLDRD